MSEINYPQNETHNVSEEETSEFNALCLKAEKAALNLIARAEQNSLGLTAKLQRKGYDMPVVKTVISSLSERGLLDDTRYAECWLRSRLSLEKAQSPHSLLVHLRKRGINRNSSQEALKNVLDPEMEYKVLMKYAEKNNPNKFDLKSEGFSSEAIEKYFHSL
jgi:regulatory protein